MGDAGFWNIVLIVLGNVHLSVFGEWALVPCAANGDIAARGGSIARDKLVAAFDSEDG